MPIRVLLSAAALLLTAAALAQTEPKPSSAGAVQSGAAPEEKGVPAKKPPAKKSAAKRAANKTPKPSAVTETAPAQQRATTRPPAPKKAPVPPGSAAAPLEADTASLAKEKDELLQLRATTLNLIRLLVEQGVLSREKAEQLVREAERGAIAPTTPAPPAAAAAAPPAQAAAAPKAAPAEGEAAAKAEKGVVRVPYVPQIVRDEIRDEVREEVLAQAKAERWGEPGALPDWLDRISFDADLRFRYQGNMYPSGNTPALIYNALTGSNLSNTTENENRYVVRARLAVNGKLSEQWFGRFSITTGNGLNPISLNQNFANYFSGFGAQIDQAYIRYTPREWATASLGRMPRPYLSTEIIWWDDLNFDGLAGTLRPRLTDSVTGLVTLGGYLIQNSSSSSVTPDPKAKYLLGAQLGGTWDATTSTRVNLAAAYYDFENVQGIRNPTLGSQIYDWTAPQFRQKGNSVFNIDNDGNPTTNLFALASKFKVIDLTGTVDLAQLDPYVVRLGGAYLKNIGFDRAEIRARTGLDLDAETTGYEASVLFGKPEIKASHDWHAFAIYRRIGRDAVMDAFNDPDFYLGGTNYKGYQLGLRYGFTDRAWVRLRWMSGDAISGPPLSIDVLQFDVNARF